MCLKLHTSSSTTQTRPRIRRPQLRESRRKTATVLAQYTHHDAGLFAHATDSNGHHRRTSLLEHSASYLQPLLQPSGQISRAQIRRVLAVVEGLRRISQTSQSWLGVGQATRALRSVCHPACQSLRSNTSYYRRCRSHRTKRGVSIQDMWIRVGP